MGMPHRGRLNVLTNVIRKPTEQIFKEFAGTHVPVGEEGEWTGSGDVKYHMGTSFDRRYPDGREVHIAMLANPSHLEAVNPLVVGKAKAKMHALGDVTGDKVMPIIIHGDAAFAGQGICYEQMQLAQLPNYHTGGTLHVIANNQVGFTTDPSASRSTKYCSDLGKTFNAPIFHVNADDAEAVCSVFELAVEWRMKFHTDVIIDLIGYRKHGHNELDQPSFTQPMLYKVIAKHPSPLTVHSNRLISEGAFTKEEIDTCVKQVDTIFEEAFENSKTYKSKEAWLTTKWEGVHSPKVFSKITTTGVELAELRKVGKALTTFPEGFSLHRQIQKIHESKAESILAEKGIDWGTAEALAFGSLLQGGIHVRLSGEDVERGTFSHRHASVHDQKTGQKYTMLANVEGNKSDIVVCNSPLSEYGVLGFDLGYSLEDPNQLVLWEAQFGDFVNGGQIIIDQFLSCGETKWMRQTGLVMLLPHGYDGMGPDHSSCRIERFLQSCEEDPDEVPQMSEDVRMQVQKSNWQIVNCTTPAQYFHVLRRQIMRKFRKPLIVVAPKNMLKMRDCQSSFEEMGPGTQFKRLIPEPYDEELVAPDKIRRLLMCSGKVYYELLAHRRKTGVTDVAIARLEQIQPFPFDKVAAESARYPNAEVVWMQEEPKNMGCWTFVQDRILTACKVINDKQMTLGYVGRGTMASTAEGYGSVHVKNQLALMDLSMSDNVTSYPPWATKTK
jgi:2-oxoglutarate dehydrogenase E1 component